MATPSELVDIGGMITRRESYRDGRPYLAGTGISVGRIGILWNEGLTPEQMRTEVLAGAVSLEQIYAAVAYYLANKDAIDAEVDADDADFERAALAR